MSFIKKNKQRLIPWNRPMFNPWDNTMLKNFLSTDDFFDDDFFEDDSLMPAMNVKETKDKLKVELAAPGFSKKDFEVTLDEDILHISAEKKKEEKEEDNDTGYSRREFIYNSFKRSLKLPIAISQDEELKATYKDGILKISLNKVEDTKAIPTRKIEVA